MDEFLGCIKLFGFNFAPRGWLLCQGQLLSIAQNTALFSLLGTTYGGDGRTNFAVPDLQGRSAVGMGNPPGRSSYAQGQAGGNENTTLTVNNLPAHIHAATAVSQLYAEAQPGSSQNPQNRMLGGGQNLYADEAPSQNRPMSTQSIITTVTVAPAGSGQAVATMSPYLALNYSICTEGIFPSRP